MAQINGTTILVYSNGVAIAAQRGGSISISQNLPSASNKGSGGWADHINGERSATIDFDALYSTTGLSADGLISVINNRTAIEVIWYGSTASSYHYRGQADPSGITIDAPTEDAVSISGSFVVKGELFQNAAGTSGLIAGADTSDGNVCRSLDRGVAFEDAISNQSIQAISACTDRLGRYYYYLTGGYLLQWDHSTGAEATSETLDGSGEAGDKVRCSYTGQYLLAFDSTTWYKSDDYSATWTSATATVVDCDVASGGVYQVYCTASQVYRSTNSGSSFTSLVYPGSDTLLGCSVNDSGDVLIIDDNNDATFYLQGTGWSAADALGATPADVCMNDTYGLIATDTDLQKFTKSGEGLSELSTDAFTLVTTDKNGNTAFATDGTTVYIYDGTTLTSQGTKDLKDIYTP